MLALAGRVDRRQALLDERLDAACGRLGQRGGADPGFRAGVCQALDAGAEHLLAPIELVGLPDVREGSEVRCHVHQHRQPSLDGEVVLELGVAALRARRRAAELKTDQAEQCVAAGKGFATGLQRWVRDGGEVLHPHDLDLADLLQRVVDGIAVDLQLPTGRAEKDPKSPCHAPHLGLPGSMMQHLQ